MKLAERMNRLGTETAFEVLVRARALEAQGRDIIHLEVGEPDFDTPANIIEAGAEALRTGWTHYGPCCRTARLRSRDRRLSEPARAAPATTPTTSWSPPAASRSCSS